MYFLLNIGIFQMIILVFRGVIHFVSINRTVTIERVCKVKGLILPWQEGWHWNPFWVLTLTQQKPWPGGPGTWIFTGNQNVCTQNFSSEPMLVWCIVFFWWYLKNLAEPMWWDACRSHLQISNLVQPAPTVHHSLLDFFQKISFTEHVHIFHYFPHFLVTHTATCLCPPRKRKVVCGLPLLGVHQSGNKSLHNIRIAL